MPLPGLRYLSPTRTFRNFFGRFGITGGSIRGIWNGIVPVAVVDRYRDDTEGSLFGTTMTANVAANQHAAFAMGSVADDWELLAFSWGWFFPGALTFPHYMNMMIYTPTASFTPVTTPAPVGTFAPGLNTDFAFTFSGVVGVAGHNPGLPTPFGWIPMVTRTKTSGAVVTSANFQQENAYNFPVPLRIYRNVTLGFTMVETVNVALDVTITTLYRVRPRTTEGPRTG